MKFMNIVMHELSYEVIPRQSLSLDVEVSFEK